VTQLSLDEIITSQSLQLPPLSSREAIWMAGSSGSTIKTDRSACWRIGSSLSDEEHKRHGTQPLPADCFEALKLLQHPEDESLDDGSDLADPDLIAAEIIEDLRAALDEFAAIQGDLAALDEALTPVAD
jgi:hypothetical protein